MPKFMGILLIIGVAVFVSGCFQTKQDFTLNPDGSGKVKIVLETPPNPDIARMDEGCIEEMMKKGVRHVLEKSSGVDAWKDVAFKRRDDGSISYKYTAYFQDLSKFKPKLSGDGLKIAPIMKPIFTKDARGNMALRVRVGEDNDTEEALAAKLSEEEIAEKIKQERVEWGQTRFIMAPFLALLKKEMSFRLPGTLKEATNLKRDKTGVLRITLEGAKILEVVDEVMADEALLRQMIIAGREDFTRNFVIEKLFGEKAPIRAIVTGDLKPLFDYETEVAAARKNYPGLLKELGLAAATPVAPTRREGFKRLAPTGPIVIGDDVVIREPKVLPARREGFKSPGIGKIAYIGRQAWQNTSDPSSPWIRNSAWDLPGSGGSYLWTTFGDLDGDGDFDAYLVYNSNPIVAYENIGSSASPSWQRRPAWDFYVPKMEENRVFCAKLVDLDNDGRVDLIVSKHQTARVYRNIGGLSPFCWQRKSEWDVYVSGATNFGFDLGDLDNDGDFDLVMSTWGFSSWPGGFVGTKTFENIGSPSSPSWQEKPAWTMPLANYPALGDIDGDRDLDILFNNKAYENIGGKTSPVWTLKPEWNINNPGGQSAPFPTFVGIEEDASPVGRAVYPEEGDPFEMSRRFLKEIIPEEYIPLLEEMVVGFKPPMIEVTGFMVVGDKIMVSAKIESVGRVILRQGEEVVIKPQGVRRDALTLFVKEITPSEVVLILEGEQEIRRRFR